MSTTKTCTVCKRDLPVSAFHRRRHYVKAGVRAACKDCTRAATRRARLKSSSAPDAKKQRVRARTKKAVRRGELVQLPCSICGEAAVEAHHPRYEGQDAHLIVEWLCKKHHALEHGKRSWTKQGELFPKT